MTRKLMLINKIFFAESSSDSSDEDSDKGERSKVKQRSRSPVRILSEKEMNDLGAKIVKSEIMGNEVKHFLYL
jgi:hypothetical protein